MPILNSKWLALVLLVAFLAFCFAARPVQAKPSYNEIRLQLLADYEREKPKPVVLWKRDRRAECGEDWLCIVAWAEENKNVQ